MLFVIDMQNDFVNQDEGVMAVRGADKLVKGILNKIEEYEVKNDLIFYTINIHENMPDDKRTKKEKEWGQDLFGPLKDALKDHKAIRKYDYGISMEKALSIKEKYKDKEEYSKTIELVGVETNICVLTNAIILQSTFPHAKIIIDGKLCMAKDLNLHKESLNVMEGLNMEVKR